MAKETKFKEPSKIGLVLTAFSGIFLGGLLAVTILMSTPVSRQAVVTDSGKAEPSTFSANYAPGVVSGTESPNLKSGIRRIENKLNGELTFTEGEVNYFLSQFASEASAESNVKRGSPNFKILEEKSILGLPLTLDPGGENFSVTLQVHGQFEIGEGGPTFVPNSLYVNSFKVPLLGGVLGSVVTKTLSQVAVSEKLVLGWQTISTVQSPKGGLLLTVGEGA